MSVIAAPHIVSDSRPLENRTPRPKACTFCRSSKHRCDGQEGFLPCSRCVRNLRECTWPERKQMGRKPKNLKRSASKADLAIEHEEVPAFAQASSSYQTTTTVPRPDRLDNDFTLAGSQWDVRSALLVSDGINLNIPELPTLSPQLPHFTESIASSFFGGSASTESSTPGASGSSESTSFSSDGLNKLSETGDAETSIKLIEVFYTIPHLYIPVLPPKDEFGAQFSQQGPLLRNSVFAIASTYASFPVSEDYRTLALGQLESYDPDVMDSFSTESVQYMQAILLLVCLEFGMGNVPFASELMKRACTFAVQKGWNSIDIARGDMSRSGYGFTVNRDGPLVRRDVSNVPSISDDQLTRRLRIIWWECWACDVVMSVTCRQQRNFHGVSTHVSLPNAPALYREPGCPIVWYYPLRIRIMTILVEAVAFPGCQDERQRQQHSEQFFTLNTLLDNLMLETHLAWADCMKVSTAYSGQLSSTPLGLQAAIGMELFFMAILMLHAASIHLHHLYAMPEVNFDLQVCGITTRLDILELQQTDADENYTENIFKPSLDKIVTASRALLGLMRSSHQTSVLAITQHALPSLGTSSYTPKRGTIASEEPIAVTEDILRHSPFCGCSQVVAAFGAALEVATATSKWQAMAAESNFETSKMVLQRVKRIWPVAAIFEDELDKCHGAVQSALQLW